MASRGNWGDLEEFDEETDYEDYELDDEEFEEEDVESEAAMAESPELEVLVVPAGGGDGAGEAEEVVLATEAECEESGRVTEEQLQAESDLSCLPSCPVCLVPWTSDGPHRVCCIPCGHVYGRSCLERWIKKCKKNAAKCPICCASFKQTEMINLYAPLIAVSNIDLEEEVLLSREKNESHRRHLAKGVRQAEVEAVHPWGERSQDDLEARLTRMELEISSIKDMVRSLRTRFAHHLEELRG